MVHRTTLTDAHADTLWTLVDVQEVANTMPSTVSAPQSVQRSVSGNAKEGLTGSLKGIVSIRCTSVEVVRTQSILPQVPPRPRVTKSSIQSRAPNRPCLVDSH